MSRLVRSPAAPKIAMVAGEGRWSGKHFAIVAASAAIVVIGLLSSWGDVVGRLLRRDEGALASWSMLALLTIFQPTRSAPTSLAARSNRKEPSAARPSIESNIFRRTRLVPGAQ